MGILDSLKNVFIPPSRGGLLRHYLDRSLFILSLNSSGPALPDDMTQEQILDAVRRNAEEVKHSSDLSLFTFEQDGVRIAPIFSSSELAQKFVQNGPITQATFFTLAELNGRFLLEYLLNEGFSGHQIILNPLTEQERHIAQTELRSAIK